MDRSGDGGVLQSGVVHSHIPATPTGLIGSDLDTEEGRSFLQQRIALFAKTVTLISLLFLAVDSIVLTFGYWQTWADSWQRTLAHALAILLAVGCWLLTRRGNWSMRALVTIDLVVTMASLVAYAFTSVRTPSIYVVRVDLVINLISIVFLMFRAVIVPGTPGYTGTLTAVGMIPAMLVGHHVSTSYQGHPALPAPFLIEVYSLLWTVAVVTMTTLISRTIYRLRAEVRAAQKLGQYVLGDKIGEGGMGAVYRAQHALLRRPTALKLILPERVGKQAIARFEREVQMTARLTHPNTVNVYDYGHTPDGIFYYAMEYLDGIDLEHLVSEFGPQPPARVVHILKQVVGALAEAHDVGLVHRDVKPANIILCERGLQLDTAKIVDFGLVKDLRGLGDPGLSHVNSVIGTPLYLAPEALLRPEELDARADLYALGAVGYFLLTGTPVFKGSTAMEVCAQHLHNAPEPPSVRLGSPLPEGLEKLILRCLAKKPEARPQTAVALGAELDALGIEPWSQEQARAWWRDNEAKIEAHPARRSRHSPISAVTIDLAARVFHG